MLARNSRLNILRLLADRPEYATSIARIADIVGVTRESASRSVSTLRRCGYVVKRGRQVLLTNDGYKRYATLREQMVERLNRRKLEVAQLENFLNGGVIRYD